MIGKPYGDTRYLTEEGIEVRLYRGPRNACRWYGPDDIQVGPELSNVAPAIVYAYSRGWIDPTVPAWLNAGAIAEVRRDTKVRP